MINSPYHYTECGLKNIYLINGFNVIQTPEGTAVSINDIEGLHRAIGLFLVTKKKDLNADDVRFLRHELLMSQTTLANLFGVKEQTIHRWENGKVLIPKPSAALLRLLYLERINNKDGEVSKTLKKIAQLEDQIDAQEFRFKDTAKGWQSAA